MDCAVCKRGREKETVADRDVEEGEFGAGFRSLQGTHRVGDGVQIPRKDFDSDKQRLAGGGRESQEGEAKLGTAGKGAWQGGRRPQGVTEILHRRDTGGSALRVRNMGSNKEDRKGPGQLSVQVRAEAHGKSAAAQEGQDGRDLVLPFFGRGNEGGRYRPDTDVNPSEAEYGRAIYCDAADYGPVQKGHQAYGRAGIPAVVRTDGNWL